MSSSRVASEIRRLGTCRVNYKGREMGYTKGGVTAKITVDIYEITVDQFGVVPLDAIDRGTTIEAVTPLAQTSFDNYTDAFPTLATILAANQLSSGRKIGTSLGTGRLILDPINDSDGIVIYKAWVKDVAELGYNNDGERILGVTWGGQIDEDRAEGDKCFRIFGGMS